MKRETSNLQSVAALLLLAVFASCAVTVLISGADIYDRIHTRDQTALDMRTAEAYITARIRSYDTADAIQILDITLQPVSSGPILELKETVDGRNYHTLLYTRDNQLMELYSPTDAGLGLSDGEPVLNLDYISFQTDQDALIVSITSGPASRDIRIQPRSQEAKHEK